ncbi:MAG: GntR family transcriptional regulator [Brevinema sp.]
MPSQTTQSPAYVRVKHHFLQKIRANELRVGDKLPSEQEIATLWGISKMTVRHGLQELVKEGIITARHGIGFFVLPNIVELDTFRFMSFSERNKQNISTEVLVFEKRAIDEKTSQEYFQEVHPFVWYSERVRFLKGEPALYEVSYMPHSFFPTLTAEDLKISKYAFVRQNSMSPIAFSDRVFNPVLLEKPISDYLGLKPNTAVIEITSTGFLANSRVFEHVFLYHHPKLCVMQGRSPFIPN